MRIVTTIKRLVVDIVYEELYINYMKNYVRSILKMY